jgi:DNA-binding transcriptional regulator YdaS (Cro superfamily)
MVELIPLTSEGKRMDRIQRRLWQAYKLRYYAKRAGMNTAQIAARIGVSNTTVQGWWYGRNAIAKRHHKALAGVVGCEPIDFAPPGEERGWEVMSNVRRKSGQQPDEQPGDDCAAYRVYPVPKVPDSASRSGADGDGIL